MKFAAPFLSTSDPNFVGNRRSPILLVGQATKGNWFLPEFEKCRDRGAPIHERAEDGRQYSSEFQTDGCYEEHKHSNFWQFHRRLRRSISAPLIWTNLAKIGVQKGNPGWKFVSEQSELAQTTLNAEIAHYKPSLVILVTGRFGRHEVVSNVFDVDRNKEKDSVGIFLSRNAAANSPAILWTEHPGRQRTEITMRWLDSAKSLYKSS
jgi:hypothetical protein